MRSQQTINCRGRILDLSEPLIMGILNLSPNSFFDGGLWKGENFLFRVEQMLNEGADIIDIGGMSSKPGSDFISEEIELERIIKPLEAIVSNFPEAILSIDTWRSKVVKESADAGAHIINDISAGSFDEELFKTVADSGLPYILMHMKGTPKNMQQNPEYNDILPDVLDFFIKKIELLRVLNIKDIILDPGFGFGKTLEQNYKLLAGLKNFKMLGLPILAGISRKSMICKVLNINSEFALNGTTAAHVLSLEQGASILRVHDVRAAFETIKIWQFYKKESPITTFI